MAGEGLALVGPNGAGKSTALLVAAGVLAASEGEARVLGLDPSLHHRARSRTGWVSHEGVLDPAETVSQQVYFLHQLRGGGEPGPETAREVLALGEHWELPVGELSRGYRRRAELAAALVGGPALLLLDEPLAGLDRPHRDRLTTAVRELAPRAAVLAATHLPEELRALVPETLGLREGRPEGPESEAPASS